MRWTRLAGAMVLLVGLFSCLAVKDVPQANAVSQVAVPAFAPARFTLAAIAFLVSFGEGTEIACLTMAQRLTRPVCREANVQFDVEPTVTVISVLTILGAHSLERNNRVAGLDRVWAR